MISNEDGKKTYVLENLKEKSISTENFPDNIVSTNPYSSSASSNLGREVATFGRVSTF